MISVARLAVMGVLAMLVWVTPAQAQDIDGTWQFTVELDVGRGRPTFVFTQDGDTLSGIYQGIFDEADVSGTIQDDRVEFWFELQGGKVTYSGTVDASTMIGTCDYVGVGSGIWKGERVAGE
jgi:hypothetical protein